MKLTTVFKTLLTAASPLVVAKIPPVLESTTRLDNLRLGDSATFWYSMPEGLFYHAYLIGTYPNGTSDVFCWSTSFAPPGIKLEADGSVSFENPSDSAEELCIVNVSGGWSFGCGWIPLESGNWTFSLGVTFFYSDGPKPYTYREGTNFRSGKVCLKQPLIREQVTVSTHSIEVKPLNASITSIDISSITVRPNPYQTGPVSTIELPATLTGTPFKSAAGFNSAVSLHAASLLLTSFFLFA
ncbi:hypothetical protein FRC17_002804 [Serendipita sp. 399]|nr:hypothetical protein FRC17_002804 [Serendipita sp. 399]